MMVSGLLPGLLDRYQVRSNRSVWSEKERKKEDPRCVDFERETPTHLLASQRLSDRKKHVFSS